MNPPIAQNTAVLGDFADVILELAHKLDIRSPALRGIVPLTGTEVAVIRELHRHPRSTPSRIAQATGLQRSNVSIAVRTLESGGLVVRESVPGNARSVVLVATHSAVESLAQIRKYWTDLLADVPAADLDAVIAALPALSRVAAALRAGAAKYSDT